MTEVPRDISGYIIVVTTLTLYTLPGCHLCDDARALLAASVSATHFDEIDIGADPALMERYGARIPVLRRDDGQELNWPFSIADIAVFLRR